MLQGDFKKTLQKANNKVVLELSHQSLSVGVQKVLYDQNADWIPAGLNENGHFFTLETIKTISDATSYEEDDKPSSDVLHELQLLAEHMMNSQTSYLLLT